MKRSVSASRVTWTHSLRMSALSRRNESAFMAAACRSWSTLSMWMKTSSRRGSTSRHDSVPPLPVAAVDRADRAFERGAVGSGDMERPAEHGGRLDAGHAAQPPRGGVDVRAGHLEGDEAGMPRHLAGVALHHDVPVGEIDDAMAALGLVHVVGGDQHGEAFAGEVVDHVPELAARLGVDAGGRLVEQQQLRLVQDAGGEREALLPAAGKLPGQLAAPVAPAPCGR